jgi:hypothetical protein
VRTGGFGQTASLHLDAADGRRFVFRSVNKDPSRGLPSLLRGTFVDDVVRDQVSALHPDAALVVAPLLEAVGVLHATPRLYVMPDDAALGGFRASFAGVLAMLEERPDEAEDDQPGFAESRRVLNTENFFTRLERTPRNRLDAGDFLAARLMDLYVGDRDRHSDQWRWARFPDDGGGYRWRPIPRDRDQAFFALGGLMASISRLWTPQFVSFGKDYPNLVWATWNGRDLDRRLLVELERPTWDSVAAAVQAKLTDSVIDDAVRRMPAPHYARNGPELARILKRRRDRLLAVAGDYYRLLAEYVDIHASDRNETAEITRLEDGAVEVRLYRGRRREPDESDRYLRRLFHSGETREIRLFMHGGDDRVVLRGAADRSILLHVVGGGGDDRLIDSSVVRLQRRRTRFYDARGDNEFVTGPSTTVDERERTRDSEAERYAAPGPTGPFGIHTRNWGSWWRPVVWTGVEPDVGVFLGGGAVVYAYGFRKVPYKYRLTLRAGYALSAARGRAEVELFSPSLAYNLQGTMLVRASGIETLNFYGFGNGTPEVPDDVARLEQQQYQLVPSLTVLLVRPEGRAATTVLAGAGGAPSLALSFGPVVKVSRTEADPEQVVGQVRPLGINTFAQVGLTAGLRFDSRDRLLYPSRGLVLAATGRLYPPVLTVEEPFGRLEAEARAYLTPGGAAHAPTFAFRVGAEKVWGDFPFFEAAFVGGPQTVRGFHDQRFAGDASAYGSGELRLPLTRYSLIVPGELGVFGFADAGRVFTDADPSDRWHVGVGGGIWLSLLDRANTVSLAVARSRERLSLYASAGFGF